MKDIILMKEIAIALMALIGGSAMGTALTLYAGKGKSKAETGEVIVQTAEKVVELQQDMLDRTIIERSGMEHKLDAALAKITAMEETIVQMRIDQAVERATCDTKLTALHAQIVDLQYHQQNPQQFPQEHPVPQLTINNQSTPAPTS